MFPKLLSKDFGIRYSTGEISATQALFIVRRDACLFASKPASQPSPFVCTRVLLFLVACVAVMLIAVKFLAIPLINLTASQLGM